MCANIGNISICWYEMGEKNVFLGVFGAVWGEKWGICAVFLVRFGVYDSGKPENLQTLFSNTESSKNTELDAKSNNSEYVLVWWNEPPD